jgi:hypothetical protein
MGFNRGRLVATSLPNGIEYPFEIAAKLARCSVSCTQEEVSQLVSETKRIYDLCKEQDATIRTLRKELEAAEATVRMLQVTD